MSDEHIRPTFGGAGPRRSSTSSLEYARSRSRRQATVSNVAHPGNRSYQNRRNDRRASDTAIDSKRSSSNTDHQPTSNAQLNSTSPSNMVHANLVNNADGDAQLNRIEFVAPLGKRLSATRISTSSESKLEVAKHMVAANDGDSATPRRSSTGALERALAVDIASHKLRKHRNRRRDGDRRESLAAPPVQSISFRTNAKTTASPPSTIRAPSSSRTETNITSLPISNNIDPQMEETHQTQQKQEHTGTSSDNSLTIDAVTTNKERRGSHINTDKACKNSSRSELNSSVTDGSVSSFSWWATTFRRNSVSQLRDGVLVDNEVTDPSTFFQHLESISTMTKRVNVQASRMDSSNGPWGRDQVKGRIEALTIYESLASSIVDDQKRSVAFPLYFCLFQYAECNCIQAKCRQSFMMQLANNFVRESKGQDFHLCVALALQAQAHAQEGEYDKALASCESLKFIYDIKLSSKICDFYGTDRAAQCHSVAVLWLIKSHNVDGALKQSKYVIDSLLPNMDQSNLPNLVCTLYPILVVLKDLGKASAKRAKDLCEQYVLHHYVKNVESSLDHHTLPLILFKPLHVLLIVNADEYKHARWRSDLTSVMLWAAEADNGRVSSDLLACTMSSLGWNSDTLMAELCFQLSRFAKSEPLKKKLLVKSKRLASMARADLTNKCGTVLNPIAFEGNEKLIEDLQEIKCSGGKNSQQETGDRASKVEGVDMVHCIEKYITSRRRRERMTDFVGAGGEQRRGSLASIVSQKSSMSSKSGTRIAEPRLVEARSRMA